MRGALLCLSLLPLACCGSPPALHHLVVTAETEPRHCFVGDAKAAIEAFGSDSAPELMAEASASDLVEAARSADQPTLVYYAGHGSVDWNGPVIGASQWLLGGGSEPLRLSALLQQMTRAPWVSVIAAACESAWVDISSVATPVSIVSASQHGFVEEPTEAVCRETSTFGRILAAGLGGGADTNHDCLVTDEEIARYVNKRTTSWTEGVRPMLHVTRNRPTQFPVARVHTTPTCEENWRFMSENAAALGAFGPALEQQVLLAQGRSVALPPAVAPLYVLDGSSRELAAAARAHPALQLFPGDAARAARLAKLTISSRIFALGLASGILTVRDLAGGPQSSYPARGRLAEALADALGGCGRVERATPEFLYVRFPDVLPAGDVKARDATSSLARGWLLPCRSDPDNVVGSCWRLPYDAQQAVYDGDPVTCPEPLGG